MNKGYKIVFTKEFTFSSGICRYENDVVNIGLKMFKDLNINDVSSFTNVEIQKLDNLEFKEIEKKARILNQRLDRVDIHSFFNKMALKDFIEKYGKDYQSNKECYGEDGKITKEADTFYSKRLDYYYDTLGN